MKGAMTKNVTLRLEVVVHMVPDADFAKGYLAGILDGAGSRIYIPYSKIEVLDTEPRPATEEPETP